MRIHTDPTKTCCSRVWKCQYTLVESLKEKFHSALFEPGRSINTTTSTVAVHSLFSQSISCKICENFVHQKSPPIATAF